MIPAPARADWLVTPFLGLSFAGETDLVDLEGGAESRHTVYGASIMWLDAGVLGIEGDVGFIPGFFQRDDASRLVVSSSVVTVGGSVVVAAPLRWTADSLRPYATFGLGTARVRVDDVLDVFELNRRFASWSIGGGAMGFLTDTVGLRWDIRRFATFTSVRETDPTVGTRRLTFWRAAMGVVLRY